MDLMIQNIQEVEEVIELDNKSFKFIFLSISISGHFSSQKPFWASSHKRLFLEIPSIPDRSPLGHLQRHFSPLPQTNHPSRTWNYS